MISKTIKGDLMGLAGGDWSLIANIINTATPDIHITLVELSDDS